MPKILIKLFTFCAISISYANAQSKKDSLFSEKTSNLVFVIHSVNKGETIYSLVNQYGCTVKEVFELNPSLKNQTAILLGQVIKFPLIRNGKHVTTLSLRKVKPTAETKPIKITDKTKSLEKSKSLENKKQPNSKPELSANNKDIKSKKPDLILKEKDSTVKKSLPINNKTSISQKEKYHLVKPQETLFSLAKQYNIEIDELAQANNLMGTTIKIGQKLLVDTVAILKIIKKEVVVKPKTFIFDKIKPEKKITQEGIAEVINTNNRSNNYLALHHSAAVGSIIQVINEANGATIMVKVVGNLNAVGPDQETLIKLSPYAFFKLKPKDSKLRAKIIYYDTKSK